MVSLHILHFSLVSALLFTSVSGYCHSPRVRKEWRCISPDERASWIKAVKCLAKVPHNPNITTTVDPAISVIPPLNPNSSYYDDFVYTHMDLNVLIHGTGFFLPWHRLYIWAFEDALRSKCGYDGVQPYWDWTKDTADPYHMTFLSDSEYDGLGTWGDPNNDIQISTGGLKDIMLAYPSGPHRIRRNFTLYFPQDFPIPSGVPRPDPTLMVNTTFTSDIVNTLVSSYTGDYVGFQASLEGGPHPGPHFILGGDMGGTCPFGTGPPECVIGPKWSPNDPTFFLHHAMVDKVWYDWQNRDPKNKNIFTGGSVSWLADSNVSVLVYPNGAPPLLNMSSVIPSDRLWKDTTVADVLDTAGKLCYVYE